LDRRKRLAVKGKDDTWLNTIRLIKFHFFPAEKFEEAKKLKFIIEELSKESQSLCKFELDKREAIKKENYEDAQKIKVTTL